MGAVIHQAITKRHPDLLIRVLFSVVLVGIHFLSDLNNNLWWKDTCMKNIIQISSTGEDIVTSIDDETNRLFINDDQISSSDWTGTGYYSGTFEGHTVTIKKVADLNGNVGIRKTADYTYELYKHKTDTTVFHDVIDDSDPTKLIVKLKNKEGTELVTNDIDASDIVNIVYPVGSIYMSVNNTSPATLFGGTWEQIEDTFLLAAGSTYTAGDIGGEAEHTLTVDEMPSHDHGMKVTLDVNTAAGTFRNTIVGGGSSWSDNDTNQIQDSGSGSAHNNMPPYLAVYVWKRTA